MIKQFNTTNYAYQYILKKFKKINQDKRCKENL